AHDQQRHHDVHGNRISLGIWYAGVDLELADIVHQYRAGDARGRPGGQFTTVDGADGHVAVEVAQIRRPGGKCTAVHADADAEEQHEQEQIAGGGEVRHHGVQHDPQGEERVVGVLAPDVVGQGGPAEAAAHVEHAQQADETRGGACADAHHFLRHG